MKKMIMIVFLLTGLCRMYECSPLSAINATQSVGFSKIETADTLAHEIDALMLKYYKEDEPGAALIVCKNNDVIFSNAYGLADMQLNVTLEPDMVFKIGSTTKQFTAVAVMLLVEQEKLSLDDPIIKYLPGCPEAWGAITIRHLLTHTSGIDDYIDYDNIRDDQTVDELIDGFKNRELVFQPGDKWKYSNPGYVLLGKIIEVVSEQSYEQFLYHNLFEPGNMKSTTLGNNSRIIPDLVSGYRKNKDRYYNARYMSMTHPYAAGGLVSSVEDMAKWHIALINGQIISRANLRQCFVPYQLNDGKLTEYGYGWFVNKFKGRYNVSHGGGVFGFVNHTMYLPQEDVYVALLSNRIIPEAVPGTQGIAERIAAITIGEPIKVKKVEMIQLLESELKIYEGLYKLDKDSGRSPMNIRRIMVEGKHIYFGINEQRRIEIFPETKESFFVKDVAGLIRFEFDEQGNVIRFIQKRANGNELIGVKTLE